MACKCGIATDVKDEEHIHWAQLRVGEGGVESAFAMVNLRLLNGTRLGL